jgi:hypothetical protein
MPIEWTGSGPELPLPIDPENAEPLRDQIERAAVRRTCREASAEVLGYPIRTATRRCARYSPPVFDGSVAWRRGKRPRRALVVAVPWIRSGDRGKNALHAPRSRSRMCR